MKCPYCGKETDHPVTACPSVRSVEFSDDGKIIKVEKFPQREPNVFTSGSMTSTPYMVTYRTYLQGHDGNNKEEPHDEQ